MQRQVNRLRRIAAQAALAALLVAGGFGAPMLMAPVAAPVAVAAPRQACPDPQERAFLRRINSYRRQHGRQPLVIDSGLMRAAHKHSMDMTKMARVTGHNLLGGVTPKQNLINHGYPVKGAKWGENLAMGTTQNTGGEVFNQWKGSPTHNQNMLRGAYRAIGIARVYDASSTYGWYWTTTFGSVIDSRPKC